MDMIGGTSMGAVIAAEYALGWDAADDGAAQPGHLRALAPGSHAAGAVAPGRASQRGAAGERIGDVQIEDLWLPYFCVSSNLSRAEMMIHRAGSLWRSCAPAQGLPGVLPPVVFEGDLLVDGALLRNLPADVLRELTGGGTTIAVDVSVETDMDSDLSLRGRDLRAGASSGAG